MPDFFVIVNEAGTIESVSASALELFGYAAGELHGQPARLILETPVQLSAESAPLAWLVARSHPTLHGIHRTGRHFPLRLTQHEIHGAGQTYFVLHLCHPGDAGDDDRVFLRHKDLYELATSQGRIGVWEVDYRTNHLEFSPVIGQILGLADEQIPTTVEGWKERFHPDDWQAVERETTRLLRREETEMNLECRMFHADGRIIWTFVRGRVLFAGDVPIKAVGTTTDITERKKAELRVTIEHAVARVLAAAPNLADASALILQAICEALDWEVGALWSVDGGGQVVRCVQTWHKPSAHVEEFELVTKNQAFPAGFGLPGRVWPTRQPAWVPDVVKDDNFPRAQVAARSGLHAALAFPILLKDAVLGVLEFFSHEIKQPDEELLRMMAAIGSQIGQYIERRKAEEERDLLFRLSLDMLCIADLSGKFRRVNPAFTKTLGYTSAELLAKPFLDFVHADDVQPTLAVMAELRQGKDLSHFENRYHCKDGSCRWLSWTCAAPAPGSELLYAVARDVTEAKSVQAQLEHAVREAERANRAKSDFLSRMSHELRTPLNAILGFGQLLLREPMSAKQREQVDLVVKAGRHLLQLINEVLDITRIEVGRLDVSPEPIRLADALGEAVSLTQPLADTRGILLSIEPSLALERSVIADRQRLKQVLLNLLSNAIKYNIDNGRVLVRVEVTPEHRIRVHVDDTGAGIPSDKQHRVFLPFDRLGVEATGVEGSGLGLVLSRRLVEVMGGTLTFTSQPGLGARFTIELPQGKHGVDVQEVASRSAHPGAVAGPPRTVLCIEDNEVNVRLIQAVFTSRPAVRLVTAMQGSLGLELARRDRPHLILLDVHLPDTNGLELLKIFRADPNLRDIPVVVISADATADQIERLLSTGAGEYLTKPIDIDQLLRVLDRYLK